MKGLYHERCDYTTNILKEIITKGDEEALDIVGTSAEGLAGNVLILLYSFIPSYMLVVNPFLRTSIV